VIAGEHGIKTRQVPQGLFDHLGAGIDEDPVHSRDGLPQLLRAFRGQQQAQGVFALGFLVE
jgi:hypothetical protein